ncbi:MAG: SH3 domain-containing protein [Bacteroidia bacterium]|nr:SH3 domain-containing protein [Bacteroidia bacterium]
MKKLIFLLFFLPILGFAQKNIVLVYAYSQMRGTIYLLEDQKTGYYVKEVFPCRFGYNGLRKRRMGDGKTPLGHYKVLEERPKSLRSRKQLSEFGGYFLLIDYPNYCDKRDGKSGGAIGLHGGDNNNTNGCIRVLDPGSPRINKVAIAKIARFTRYGTDVIVTDRLSTRMVSGQGRKLDAETSKYWKNLVSRRRCYSEIIKGMGSGSRPIAKGSSSSEVNPNLIYLGSLLNSRGSSTLREEKNFNSKVIGNIKGSETFVFLREHKEWYTVIKQDGTQGYLPKSRIRRLCESPSGTGQINDPDGYTNLRYGPSTRSTVIRKIERGEIFFYKERNDSWWEVITLDGRKGYMHYTRVQPVQEE